MPTFSDQGRMMFYHWRSRVSWRLWLIGQWFWWRSRLVRRIDHAIGYDWCSTRGYGRFRWIFRRREWAASLSCRFGYWLALLGWAWAWRIWRARIVKAGGVVFASRVVKA